MAALVMPGTTGEPAASLFPSAPTALPGASARRPTSAPGGGVGTGRTACPDCGDSFETATGAPADVVATVAAWRAFHAPQCHPALPAG